MSRSTTDGNLSRFDNERKHSSMLSSPGSADVSILGDVQKQDKGDSELSVTSPANIERSFKGPSQSATFFAAITQSSSKHLLEGISHDSATAAGTNIHELADMSDNLSPLQESGHVMIETRHPAQVAIFSVIKNFPFERIPVSNNTVIQIALVLISPYLFAKAALFPFPRHFQRKNINIKEYIWLYRLIFRQISLFLCFVVST